MGHYYHVCRCRAENKEDALSAVSAYLDSKVESNEIDYGYTMAVTNEDGVVEIEDRGYENVPEQFTLQKLKEGIVIPERTTAIAKLKDLVGKLTPDDFRDELFTLDCLVSDLKHSKTQKQIDDFNIFENTLYEGQLLEFGITDLNEECYCTPEPNVPTHIYFVWVNSHM